MQVPERNGIYGRVDSCEKAQCRGNRMCKVVDWKGKRKRSRRGSGTA